MLNFIRSLINIEKKRIPTKKLQIENKKIKKNSSSYTYFL